MKLQDIIAQAVRASGDPLGYVRPETRAFWEGYSGAPGTARETRYGETPLPPLDALDISAMAPGVGDVTGPLADIRMFARDPEQITPANVGMSLLGALPFMPSLAGIATPLSSKGKSLIKDWRWKNLADVIAQANVTEIPEHVMPYADMMRRQGERATQGDLGAEDLIKSFLITRGSIQRGGVNPSRFDPYYQAIAENGMVRPEDAVARWFSTPEGARYLDEAVNQGGMVSQGPVNSMVDLLSNFGRQNEAEDMMVWAAQGLPGRTQGVNDLVSRHVSGQSRPNDWLTELRGYPGIGASKAGFYGAMLGRGDLPVLDARQLALHVPVRDGVSPGKQLHKYGQRGNYEGASQAVMRLRDRQNQMGVEVPPEYLPNAPYLTHHAVWDALEGTPTTHKGILEAFNVGP